MSSKIEQCIDEIEEYIDNCRYQKFSNSMILVNKEEIEELIRELRVRTPDEIKRYQKIIQNKEEILSDARAKAEQLIKAATEQTTELINEHEIMQQAYAQANEVVKMATKQAQDILDTATTEANSMREAVTGYSDQLLAHIQGIIEGTLKSASENYQALFEELQDYHETIVSNRTELNSSDEDPADDSFDDFDDIDDSPVDRSSKSGTKVDLDIL